MKWNKMSSQKIKQKLLEGYEFTPEDISKLRNDVRASVQSIVRRLEKSRQEKERVFQLYSYERELYAEGIHLIAGIDEAGRGPLAGPVVAAAVMMPQECFIAGIDDSKKLNESKRYALEKEIKEKAVAWAVGTVGVHDIDKINIYQATCLAMRRAVKRLNVKPEHLLIDAVFLRGINIPQTSLIKGDAQSVSIAAASILAKCHRDRLMCLYDTKFPAYGFARHKGYPTPEHIELLNKLGGTCIHRRSFHIKKKEEKVLKSY